MMRQHLLPSKPKRARALLLAAKIQHGPCCGRAGTDVPLRAVFKHARRLRQVQKGNAEALRWTSTSADRELLHRRIAFLGRAAVSNFPWPRTSVLLRGAAVAQPNIFPGTRNP